MIRIENANLGDRVLTSNHKEGNIIDFRLSDICRVFVSIELDDKSIVEWPLDSCAKLNLNEAKNGEHSEAE